MPNGTPKTEELWTVLNVPKHSQEHWVPTECPPSVATSFKTLLSGKSLGTKHDQTLWWPTMLMLYWMAKRCLSNIFWRAKFLQCSMEVLSSLKFFQTRSNKVSKRENIWSRNNVWSCLIAKHFLFGQGFTQVEPLRIFYKCCLNN